MGKVKNSNIPAALTLGLILLLFLLVLACGAIALLFFYPQFQPGPPAGGGTNATANQSGSGGALPGSQNASGGGYPENVSAEDLQVWNNITVANAESVCLQKAKEEAGASAALVYSCQCSGTEGAARKTYSCNIATADPTTRYFVNIDCYLEGKACTIEYNYGTETVTFDELRPYVG